MREQIVQLLLLAFGGGVRLFHAFGEMVARFGRFINFAGNLANLFLSHLAPCRDAGKIVFQRFHARFVF